MLQFVTATLFAAALTFTLLHTQPLPLRILHHVVDSNLLRAHRKNSTQTLGIMPIKVLVCTEALCPDCKLFVQKQLLDTYKLLGDSVMDLQLVPFGNARINETTKEVICQHGPAECDANLYQDCAISIYPDPSRHLPFISCLDALLPMGYHEHVFNATIFEHCATGLAFERIKACHDIPQVAWNRISHAAKATPSYHQYVPWVELDGTHIDVDDGELLVTKICAVFTKAGGRHPACDAV